MIFLLLACNEHMIAGIEKRQQEILVIPEHINFGNLTSGQETKSEIVSIVNTGDANLTITAPDLVSGNSRFSLVLESEQEEYTILPGEYLDFIVTYEPLTYESNGAYIEILSNDQDEQYLLVTLEGYGDAPVMVLDPQSYDYGEVSIGCDNEKKITIKNEGNLNLEVTEVIQMVTQPVDILMEYGSLPELPWILEPNQEIDFLVSYIPSNVGTDQSQIVIRGSDPLTPEVITNQIGIGNVEQYYIENHIQEESAILDVLWVVDDSGSMHRFQTNLSNNIGLFLNAFANNGVDYNMAVITTTFSQIGLVINSTMSNAEYLIANEVLVGIGGNGTETGIQTSFEALSDSNSAGPGSLFFRENSTLIIIYVSDEPDHSSPWVTYTNFFDNLKPQGNFIPYAVIGDPPNGCYYTNSTAQFGSGYWDLVDYYGGSWYSICSNDWGVQLQSMANNITDRRSYELQQVDPIESTITVTVNGQQTNNWTYDQSTNEVIFDIDHIPSAGQSIKIEYAVWGCGN